MALDSPRVKQKLTLLALKQIMRKNAMHIKLAIESNTKHITFSVLDSPFCIPISVQDSQLLFNIAIFALPDSFQKVGFTCQE